VVEPPPLQSPHPPIWVAAASEGSVRRAASQGHRLLLDQYASVDQIAERIGWFGAGEIAVARQVFVARSRAEAEEALARQAAFTRRTVEVSRAPSAAGGSQVPGHADGGSHVLGYADTERHALFGTPDEVGEGLAALAGAGADYVLIQLAGGRSQVRRFARHVLPAASVVAVGHQPDLLEHP
jgi:alkanesulfonate monooxygenase SsuD/methylene tetrahydromethanopterin reductase-like flavin-dependent oxidoreductase (luciferase family)